MLDPMNYLFHLYLSGEDPEILTGNFMGDFVKGRVGDSYPARMRSGIMLHRNIDSYAEGHPVFNRSRLRLDREFGLYRGILVDLYYDHFLAVSWSQWRPEPLHRFLERTRRVVEGNRLYLPERLQGLLPVIFEDMIPSYLTTDGVAGALQRMSRRVTRANPLAGGGKELVLNYHALRSDFLDFLPEVSAYAASITSPAATSITSP